jgi:hypothetical protein
VFLYVSALCWIAVMIGTGLAGKKADMGPVEFAEPVEPPGNKALILDRMKLWVIIAAVLVAMAYAVPIYQHLQLERFGAPGFNMF